MLPIDRQPSTCVLDEQARAGRIRAIDQFAAGNLSPAGLLRKKGIQCNLVHSSPLSLREHNWSMRKTEQRSCLKSVLSFSLPGILQKCETCLGLRLIDDLVYSMALYYYLAQIKNTVTYFRLFGLIGISGNTFLISRNLFLSVTILVSAACDRLT